ncbi:hypothetical protein A3765_10530 [Oleiphilus sp. HI0130]|nr:hypothetical protein A3765_10530 [Oleiphilus sp. HI0130]
MDDFIHDGTIPKPRLKDPDSTVDFDIDWSQWLREGEVVSSSSWLASPGITVESDSFTGTATKILVSGGVVNTEYTLTNRITTSLGLAEDRSMRVICREK